MKKIYLLLLAITSPLLFTGCAEDEDITYLTGKGVLEIVSSDIGFDAAGGEGSITLKTTETDVKAVSDKNWLTVNVITDTKVSYTVAESEEALQRSAKITITAGSLRRDVTILQKGAMFDISADGTVQIDPTGQTPYRIGYETSSTSTPEVSIPEEAQKWLSATVEQDAIVLNADLNYTGDRECTITVTQAWKPVEITVTQDMVNLLDIEELTFNRDNATKTVKPTEYLAMATTSWTVSTTSSWITLNKTDESFTVEVSENTSGKLRNGKIDLKNSDGDVMCSVNVVQKSYSYKFLLGQWTMTYDGGKTHIVNIVQNKENESYLLNNWFANGVVVSYEDTGTDAYLKIDYQYMGRSGQYYVHLVPLFGESLTVEDGVGMKFTYKDEKTLEAVGDDYSGDVISGFQFAAFSSQTPSGNAYVGGFKGGTFENITSLTR